MKWLVNAFTKVTGWIVQLICFRTKVYYEDKKIQRRHIKGSAIIISNHTSVYDYAVMLFVFWTRTLCYQMAELLFKKKGLRTFLKCMGGIMVDRDAYDFSFVPKSIEILKGGGVVGIFPEARLPKQGEIPPLPFKSSVTYIALESGAPIIPVYTNGSYFCKKRARVIIGTPIYVRDLWDDKLNEKQNIDKITEFLRKKVISLNEELDNRTRKNKKAWQDISH